MKIQIDAFVNDLRDTSPQTADTYAVALWQFEKFTDAGVPPSAAPAAVHDLAATHILAFARHLARGKRSRATLATYLVAVRRFYAYLAREKVIEPLDADYMRQSLKPYLKRSRTIPHTPTNEVLEQLIRQAGQPNPAEGSPESPNGKRALLRRLRNVALLKTLKSTGMRVGELVSLTRGNLDSKTRSARVSGKGDKERMVYFNQDAWDAVQEYLKARGDANGANAAVPLFSPHAKNSGKTHAFKGISAIEKIIDRLVESNAENGAKVTPHQFRHWFATHLLEKSNNLALVQDALGHESPTTTRVYAQVTQTALRAAHRAAFEE